MKPSINPRAAAQALLDPFETLTSQVAAPVAGKALEQMFGTNFGLSSRPQSIGGAEIARARKEKELKEKSEQDNEESEHHIQEIRAQYRERITIVSREQKELKTEVVQLQQEVVQIAKAAGLNTRIHLENIPGKIGKIDIKRLTAILKTLRIKATEAKSGSELINQRSNAKRTTGMLAWVSGKQMKIHEQGTMQLQG